MRYEWDEVKRAETLATRGIDFASMESFDWATAVIERDTRHVQEIRYIATGYIGGRHHRVVYTEWGEIIRIISLRKANAREVRRYERPR